MLQEIIDVLAQYTFEEQYDIHIPDEQIMEFKTVADIEEYLEKNR